MRQNYIIYVLHPNELRFFYHDTSETIAIIRDMIIRMRLAF